jgi:hypothetical protein
LAGHRALLSLSLLIYAFALILPLTSVDWGGSLPGWAAVWISEVVAFKLSQASFQNLLAGALVLSRLSDWMISALIFSTATQLYGLAWIAKIFRRDRLASFLGGSATVSAAGCLVPALNAGLNPAVGYFAWCTAPVLLTVAAVREWRRNPMPRKG